MMHLEVHNEALEGKTLLQVKDFMGRDFVCSRILQNGHVSIPNRDTVFTSVTSCLWFVPKMMPKLSSLSLVRRLK